MMTRRSDVHNYETRGADELSIPYHRFSSAQQTIQYQGIKLFNKLNQPWKVENLNRFKTSLKVYLCGKAYYSIQEYLEQ